jgi:iron complex transport system substrate-binding protein
MLIAMNQPRIVSLVPSATETVHRLGLGHAIVGRSHVCNFPVEAQSPPVLTRPHLEKPTSRGIHEEVRERLSAGLALFDLDLDQLRELAPSHLLVQDQCSVCAVSPADLEVALSDWLGAAPTLVRLAPHQLADVWRDILTIGDAIGCGAEARALQTTLSFQLSDLVERVGSKAVRPRVACIEWLDPIMVAGHWVPELVRLAGGEPILADTGGPSRTVELAELIEARPEIVIVQACGFDLPTARHEWRRHRALESALRDATAAAGAPPLRIALVDGDAYFNRPGPRLVDSAELLAEILHPRSSPCVYAGAGWESAD